MIKNILLLTKISTRNFLENLNFLDRNTKKINKKSIYFWLIIIVIAAITFLSNEILNILDDYGQIEIFLQFLFTIASIIMLMQTIVMSMNVLYFSNDVATFLSLPIKAEELLLSKVNTIINILYGTELLFMLIPLILYGLSTSVSFLYYIFIVLVLILLPIFFATLVTLITFIIMKFIKRIKNKNRFQIIVTLFFFFLIVILEVFFMKAIQTDFGEMEEELNNFSKIINQSMIVVNPLISILEQNSVIINLIKVIAVYAIMYTILIITGKKTYIKNILKTMEYNKSKHKSKVDFEIQCKPHGTMKSYITNDFKAITKNAMFFMQTIYPIILIMLMIIFLVIYFKVGIINRNQEIADFLNVDLTIEGVCIILGLLQILYSFVNISITAISRQGSNATFMKYIPVDLYKQFWLKNIPQITINVVMNIIVIIMSKILFPKISVIDLAIIFIISIILSIVNSCLMLIVDTKRPRLDWKAEIEVFKQNPNKIYQYVWTIIVVVILMYTRKAFKDINLHIGIIAVFIIFSIMLIIVNIYVKKQIEKNKLFKNIL